MNEWFRILGFALFIYSSLSVGNLKLRVITYFKVISLISLLFLIIFIFHIGGNGTKQEFYEWFEKYSEMYDGFSFYGSLSDWLFLSLWILMPVCYFSLRSSAVNDVVHEMKLQGINSYSKMKKYHYGMILFSIISIAGFMDGFQSISKLIVYWSLSYDKLRYLSYGYKPNLKITELLIGFGGGIGFKFFFHQALILNKKNLISGR